LASFAFKWLRGDIEVLGGAVADGYLDDVLFGGALGEADGDGDEGVVAEDERAVFGREGTEAGGVDGEGVELDEPVVAVGGGNAGGGTRQREGAVVAEGEREAAFELAGVLDFGDVRLGDVT
jgi:hypothetical protein